jgi:hypothetical protein
MFSVVITVSALEVFTILTLPSGVLTSQVHPEPKFQIALLEKVSLKVSKSQNSISINLEISPFAFHHIFFPIQFQ